VEKKGSTKYYKKVEVGKREKKDGHLANSSNFYTNRIKVWAILQKRRE